MLDSVTLMLVVVPAARPPKLTMVELALSAGPVDCPVPRSEPATGPPDVSTVRDAAKSVEADGVKVTGTVRVSPSASDAGSGIDGAPSENGAAEVDSPVTVTVCRAVITTSTVLLLSTGTTPNCV